MFIKEKHLMQTNYIIRNSEDKMVDERLEDGTITHFNTTQFARVLAVKERFSKGEELPNHYLKNQSFIDVNGKIFKVDKVVKNWDCGFYLTLMFEQSPNFFIAIPWENINSIHPLVTEWINENHKKYRQVICNLNM